MQSFFKQALSPRYLGLAGLCILAGIYLTLFRYDNFGIEESAARALLLNWTIVHQIASPIALYGVPDLRALLFIILDLHWAGSLPAAKVFTMVALFGTSLLLYRWSEQRCGDESSMIATSLLLISPIAVMQTDAIGVGPYMLGALIVTHLLDKAYRDAERALNSWYFVIILVTAFSVSMHPMGLAVPLVLLWQWRRQLTVAGKGRNLLIGTLLSTMLMLLLRWGWHDMDAVGSPLAVLANDILGPELIHAHNLWAVGLIPANLIGIALIAFFWKRNLDTMSLLLATSTLLGLSHADAAWGFIAYASLLYIGTPMLLQLNQRYGWRGMVGQRGLVLLIVMVTATLSMTTLRNYHAIAKNELKSGTDAVIAVLAEEAEHTDKPFVAASQWPARTLLATRRDVLPLPPSAPDAKAFAKQIHGLTHIAFDPRDPSLHALARNAASMSDTLETIALLPAGVVLKVRQQKDTTK